MRVFPHERKNNFRILALSQTLFADVSVKVRSVGARVRESFRRTREIFSFTLALHLTIQEITLCENARNHVSARITSRTVRDSFSLGRNVASIGRSLVAPGNRIQVLVTKNASINKKIVEL